MDSKTLTIRNLRQVETFVTHAVHWLPKETYIGNALYLVTGPPSDGSARMEKLITDALHSMTFTVKELRRVRVVFEEQLEELKALSNGAREHAIILQFFEMPDLSKGRIDRPVTTRPLVLTLRHWIPEGDERLKYLPNGMLVTVPQDFVTWESELKRIVPY